MLLETLAKRRLIEPPGFVRSNTQYLVITGSRSYGTNTPESDYDVYGWCIPPKDMVFPHLRGEVLGFGTQVKRFEQWLQHHIHDPEARRDYDFTVLSIVKYLHLCLENNPNIIDTLFVPQECIIHSTRVGQMVREARCQFLHKGCWHRFKGYAYSQLKKCKSQTRTGKRADTVAEDGYDLKFASHIIRLLGEVEQILTEGNLDLQRNREQLKSVRRGDWTLAQLESYFAAKEQQLEKVYAECTTLPWGPKDKHLEENIHALLLRCLEEHYGSVSGAVVSESQAIKALRQIRQLSDDWA